MKRRIEGRPALEAYIGRKGDICLKMEDPLDGDIVIPIPPEDMEQVIDWLRDLLAERKSVPDEQFASADPEEGEGEGDGA